MKKKREIIAMKKLSRLMQDQRFGWVLSKVLVHFQTTISVITRDKSRRAYPSHLTTRTAVGAILRMMRCARIASRDRKSNKQEITLNRQNYNFVKSPNDNNGLIYVSVSTSNTNSTKNIFIRTDRNCQHFSLMACDRVQTPLLRAKLDFLSNYSHHQSWFWFWIR